MASGQMGEGRKPVTGRAELLRSEQRETWPSAQSRPGTGCGTDAGPPCTPRAGPRGERARQTPGTRGAPLRGPALGSFQTARRVRGHVGCRNGSRPGGGTHTLSRSGWGEAVCSDRQWLLGRQDSEGGPAQMAPRRLLTADAGLGTLTTAFPGPPHLLWGHSHAWGGP